MKKAEYKNKKNYLSIMLVPHSSDKVTVFKLSSLYPKLVVFLSVVVLLIIFTIGFVAYTINENHRLNNSVKTLTDTNSEQSQLIRENADELKTLKENAEKYDENIKDFINKYNEMANNYIENNGATAKTSRSKPSVNSFIGDLTRLKSILKELDTQGTGSDISESEARLNAYLDSVPTHWPTSGRISSNFGDREDPFSSSSAFHHGLDIVADYGDNIRASASGTVSATGYSSVYGYYLTLNHGNGLESFYGHTSKVLVKKGKKIKKGDLIARVGSTGRSTGPHLHFEVRLNDTAVDPLRYLSGRK